MGENFLSIQDISLYQFQTLLDTARIMKNHPERYRCALGNKSLALLSQKPDYRSRLTFEIGVHQLGGYIVSLDTDESGLDDQAVARDISRRLSRWTDGIILGLRDHSLLDDFISNSTVPVLNAGRQPRNPFQAMSVFFTIRENRRDTTQLKLAVIGPIGGISRSLLFAAAKAGVTISFAFPPGDGFDADILSQADSEGKDTGFLCLLTHDPTEAVTDADVVYARADVEETIRGRSRMPQEFHVSSHLLGLAKTDKLFFCEGTPDPKCESNSGAADAPSSSQTYELAENRLHIQKAIMVLCLEEDKE